VEASSIPSDPQRRKPDDQTCCDGVVSVFGLSTELFTRESQNTLFTLCHSHQTIFITQSHSPLLPTCFTSSLEPASYITQTSSDPNYSSPSQRPSYEHAGLTCYTLLSPSTTFSLFHSRLISYLFRKSSAPLVLS